MTLITRSERCMCGHEYVIRNADWCDIANAVRLHNAGPQHQSYMLGVMLDVAPRSLGRDGLRVFTPRREERP